MKNASILYVDEDPAVIRSTESILRSAGHSVTVARNAADAVLLLKFLTFDMLLLDCVPAFTWLTEEAKRRHEKLPVALCTDVPGYFRLPDVDAVLPKPVSAAIFLKRIANLLNPADAGEAHA